MKQNQRILLTREGFRDAVFARDGFKCVICGEPAKTDTKGWVTNLDPHHIYERRLWTASHEFGGYFKNNGVTVCETHHRLAEQTVLTVEELRLAAGIDEVPLPEHLYNDNDFTYTKWGDIIMPNGTRSKGELFHDESVQKILASAPGILELYSPYIKYPRTMHTVDSQKLGGDDRRLESMDAFQGKEVVATIKMDGENFTGYSDYYHARSVNSGPAIERKAAAAIHSQIGYQLPQGWRYCAENLYEKHTIGYDDLESYLLVFSIWDERNYCLSWEETEAYAKMLGLQTVPVIYRGIYDPKIIEAIRLEKLKDHEGYVLRLASEFPFSQFRQSVAKFVQSSFQIVHGRTANRKVIPNKLKDGRKF